MKHIWKRSQKNIDQEDPRSLIGQVFWVCTERGPKMDERALQSKTELFKRLTTSARTEQKDPAKEKIREQKS